MNLATQKKTSCHTLPTSMKTIKPHKIVTCTSSIFVAQCAHNTLCGYCTCLQWANIILVVEQTVTTDERRQQQIAYSQPMGDSRRRALVIRWHQTVSFLLLVFAVIVVHVMQLGLKHHIYFIAGERTRRTEEK